ncbi:RHS repeat-associated core domain-containing protein [Streptomyces sp. NPDC055952]|uniref:RHS repeat-associated core domain-containing protein n=1 Tax=Streptomyces sp. NPDC055952 TaxID=3345663 RepID=UPI0035E0CA8C
MLEPLAVGTTGGMPTQGWKPDGLHRDALTRTTADGNEVNTCAYSPRGVRILSQSSEQVAQPYRFAGGYQDPTGLHRFQARYYDANIGRFTQPDPSGQERNPYLYAEGDPVDRIDPNGTLSFGPVLDAISLGNDAATVGKAWNAAVDGDYGRAAGITFGLRRPAHFEEKP